MILSNMCISRVILNKGVAAFIALIEIMWAIPLFHKIFQSFSETFLKEFGGELAPRGEGVIPHFGHLRWPKF